MFFEPHILRAKNRMNRSWANMFGREPVQKRDWEDVPKWVRDGLVEDGDIDAARKYFTSAGMKKYMAALKKYSEKFQKEPQSPRSLERGLSGSRKLAYSAAKKAAAAAAAAAAPRARTPSPNPKEKTERELLADAKYRAAQTAAAAAAAAASGKSLSNVALEDALKDVPKDKHQKAREQFATLLAGMSNADKADKTKLEAKARRAAKVAMKGGRRRDATRRRKSRGTRRRA